jgi:hypothetical protein
MLAIMKAKNDKKVLPTHLKVISDEVRLSDYNHLTGYDDSIFSLKNNSAKNTIVRGSQQLIKKMTLKDFMQSRLHCSQQTDLLPEQSLQEIEEN